VRHRCLVRTGIYYSRTPPNSASWSDSGDVQCVEVAYLPGHRLVRDSKLGDANPVLAVNPDEWSAMRPWELGGVEAAPDPPRAIPDRPPEPRVWPAALQRHSWWQRSGSGG
jgi:hypothetical protein